jgi:error-prone DNA polymerase
VKGIREEDIKKLITGRSSAYTSINELRDAGVSETALEKLADADAFRSLDLDRRQALWEASNKDRPQALFSAQPAPDAQGEHIQLPLMTTAEHATQDFAAISLSVKAHPVSFIREKLRLLHIVAANELKTLQDGMSVKVAGLVLVRQRPGTAKGVCFITLKDEMGLVNLVFFRHFLMNIVSLFYNPPYSWQKETPN